MKSGRPRRMTKTQEQDVFNLWLQGYAIADLCEKFGSYRQHIRNVILSFNPTPEQYAKHELRYRDRKISLS